jgi:hypothetical protein
MKRYVFTQSELHQRRAVVEAPDGMTGEDVYDAVALGYDNGCRIVEDNTEYIDVRPDAIVLPEVNA